MADNEQFFRDQLAQSRVSLEDIAEQVKSLDTGGLGIGSGSTELAAAEQLGTDNPLAALVGGTLRGQAVKRSRAQGTFDEKKAQMEAAMVELKGFAEEQNAIAKQAQAKMADFKMAQEKNITSVVDAAKKAQMARSVGDSNLEIANVNSLMNLGGLKSTRVIGAHPDGQQYITETLSQDGRKISGTTTLDELTVGLTPEQRQLTRTEAQQAVAEGVTQAAELRSQQEAVDPNIAQSAEGRRVQAGLGQTKRQITETVGRGAISKALQEAQSAPLMSVIEDRASFEEQQPLLGIIANNLDASDTGSLAPILDAFGSAAAQLGFEPDPSLSANEQIEAAANAILLPKVKALGSNPSNADRATIERTGASVGKSKEGNMLYVAVQEYLDGINQQKFQALSQLESQGASEQDMRTAVEEIDSINRGNLAEVETIVRHGNSRGATFEQIQRAIEKRLGR